MSSVNLRARRPKPSHMFVLHSLPRKKHVEYLDMFLSSIRLNYSFVSQSFLSQCHACLSDTMSRDCQDWDAGFALLPEPIPDVGKQQLLPKIVDEMERLVSRPQSLSHPFLLCGPPGCGKKSLIQLASQKMNLKVTGAYDLAHIANSNRVSQDLLECVVHWYGGRLQKNMVGEKHLLVLYGAEFLDKENVAFLRKYDVVLVANERPQVLQSFRTIWANKLTDEEMRRSLAILQPSARTMAVHDATKLANGDLRKAQQHLAFGTGKADGTRHVFFDVSNALCKGMRKDLDWHGRRWASESHLLIDQPIEKHAEFSENLVDVDLIAEAKLAENAVMTRSDNAPPDWFGDTADVAAGLAVRGLVGRKRSFLKLKSPSDCRQSPPFKTSVKCSAVFPPTLWRLNNRQLRRRSCAGRSKGR